MAVHINRLTLKAKKIILRFSDNSSEVSSMDIVSRISSVEGMGKNLLEALESTEKNLKKKVNLNDLVKGAFYEAHRLKQPYVGSEHLLLSLLKLNDSKSYDEAQKLLSKMSIFPQIFTDRTPKESSDILDLFSTNLNFEFAGDPVEGLVERNSLDALLSILLQKESPNPLIVGEPGVGKRTLIKSLIKRINDMDVPTGLLGYRVYEVDLLSLITSNLNKGELETTLTAFYTELQNLNRVLISIKNFENLFFTTNAGIAVPLIYNSFINQLEDLGVQYIATISTDVHSRLMEDNPRVLQGFRAVNLEEPDEKETLEILKSSADHLGRHHKVKFPSKVIDYIYRKALEQNTDTKFPQKGVELLDRTAAKLLLRKAKVPEEYKNLLEESILLTQGLDKSLEYREYDEALKIKELIEGIEDQMSKNERKMFGGDYHRVAKKDVDAVLEEMDEGSEALSNSNISSLNTLEARIKEKIIGQDEAVGLVSRALLRARLGLRPENRPLGNFLFLGPTGVGKTELAKVLAEEFFGENSLIRLDMSDFGEKHTVARLVGAPPGYVGYGEGGELTSKIERNPGSLVLFDEIEKAHPDVLNILLQITEEGELVDAKGTTFDFSSAVVVLTSNLGTEIVHRTGIGFEAKFLNDASLEKRLRSNLKKILKPELLNRLDEIVVFKRLSEEDQYQILELLLGAIRDNLAARDIKLRVSHKAKDYILEKGYSEEYGARALRRTVERELLDKIAQVLLEHTEGPLRLSAVGREDGLKIRVLGK